MYFYKFYIFLSVCWKIVILLEKNIQVVLRKKDCYKSGLPYIMEYMCSYSFMYPR